MAAGDSLLLMAVVGEGEAGHHSLNKREREKVEKMENMEKAEKVEKEEEEKRNEIIW